MGSARKAANWLTCTVCIGGTCNPDRALFREAFGWTISEPGAPPAHLATVKAHPHGIAGMIGKAPDEGDPDHGVRPDGLIVYVKVPDVAATLERITAASGTTIWVRRRLRPGS